VDAALHGNRMSWQSEKAHGEEIAYQLAPLGSVKVVRFFGGAALRLDGVMFGFMSRGSLFLRVDDVNRPAFVAAGMGSFSYERPTRTVSLAGYYETPADVLEDAGAVFDWCRSAYRAALLAGPPKRKARAVTEAPPKPAPAPEAKVVSKRAAKPASKTLARPAAPVEEAKPASQRAAKPVSKASSKSAPAQNAKPASKTLPKPAPAQETRPASKRTLKPASKPPVKSATKRKQT
jgi:DNA transformation protein and related proteins